ncbi:MAG: hypothetical protein PHF57_09075 [Methanoregula sp.]|nr:hypothetical protein [Methanoregula sp.]MDD5188346.1 hypothetical protein [Methanoregula sp.]
MTTEYLPAIRLLSTPGQCLEVRAITEDGIASGYFDSPEELAATVETLDGLPTVHGIYVTINPVNPALFSRRANRIKMRLGKKDAATADADIERRHWLPIDIDPVRPSGISSTDEEHALALAKGATIAEWLACLGYPEPLRADSGNGAHLLYRIDLPNDDLSTALVRSCLETLDLLFSDEQVLVDPANYNAARIWKLYGTVSRKGDSTTERPYRRSALLSSPETFGIVSREQLETLVGQLPNEPHPLQPASARETGIDLRCWLLEHGQTIRYEKPYKDGTLYQLDQCPFSTAHNDGAYAIQFRSGAIFAGCKHTSCGGGKQRWRELRDRLDPDFAAHPSARDPKPAAPGHEPRTADTPAQQPDTAPDPELLRRAQEIYENGEFLAFTKEVFSRVWLGDQHILEAVLYCAANMSVENATDAVHIHVAGQTQSGKSDSVKTALKFVSAVNQMTKTFSPMYLFHASKTGALREMMILFTDDTHFANPHEK